MNLLEKFDKLNNRLTSLLEENKELKQHYKNLQEQHQELKEKLDESDYKNLQEENEDLKQRILNQEKQKTNLLRENERLNQQCKNLQGENMDLKQRILNQEKQKTNLLGEIEMLKQQYKNLQDKFNEIDYKNLQEENKKLKENFNKKEKQFQQHIINLEKQKNEQLEIFSQNLEKALGKLELDELNEVNENDIKNSKNSKENENDMKNSKNSKENENDIKNSKNSKEKNKPTIFPLIDDDIKDKEFIQHIDDPSGSVPFSSEDKSNRSENEHSRGSSNERDNIKVVVGLDFGTTYSGFSYCHTAEPKNIITNNQWPDIMGYLKTNTVLQYDSKFINVETWGYPALARRPSRKNQREKNESETRPVELFKLHLTCNKKPYLPRELCYKKAITDYLRKIGEVIKETIDVRLSSPADFFRHVLLVITIPAEYSNKEIAIMRDCVFNAGLIGEKYSRNLRFITEPEAVAINCLNDMGKDNILTIGSNFMIVDCGGGTVKLPNVLEISVEVHLLIKNLSIFYVKNLEEFCEITKFPFTGNREDYGYELDIEDFPILLEYISEETKDELEKTEFLIKIDCDAIKAMFDPVISRIISLIHSQLDSIQEECSAIFLAGGFSESKYLQKRIEQEFQHVVKNIRVPTRPIAAISRGAVMYGLSLKKGNVISTRILKYTYGIEVVNYWMDGDPISRKLHNGRIVRFHCLARRGTQVETNETVKTFFTPLSPLQTRISFNIFFTKEYNAKYCDEPGMRFLGKLVVNLPGSGLLDRLLFEFTFGQMEITVNVKNETDGQRYITTFKLEAD
ncbi:hypothetical protein GLOIN_2v1486447 [Rhizophagus irregularis DAOM 181602=DAOM 197198]|uniref:Hsp70 family protein n=2 Tax=Rhizophagus irregularis (strain DAOM 181602 / DAOM 197198 / MUCL 43194) TaxID=747089 RepID=A0A2P4P745_RHIID|nr:hypothetical protein GLOIN_2v1486447 [Rhizophagus irregularis DAOM 181602=DAOM 197198]POG61209.1 hypothetical protein GLOIN_2v1486447 [Rhizophagus irregularis DAOM 181602=DAOM 197198]|eukprot:XP_025168075.1 hypothetical protein GLOIN_2v1486447 [Rhizophagus irregularis DAOM 181602=DAOM 197198]